MVSRGFYTPTLGYFLRIWEAFQGEELATSMLKKCMVFWDGWVVLGCLVLSTLARGWWLQDRRDEG